MSLVKNVVQGVTGTKEYFNAKQFNSSGVRVPKDLTGTAVTIFIYNETRSAKIVDNAACTVEDLGNGILYFTTTAPSTNTVGRYLGRLKYVKGTNPVETDYSKEFVWNVEKNGAL